MAVPEAIQGDSESRGPVATRPGLLGVLQDTQDSRGNWWPGEGRWLPFVPLLIYGLACTLATLWHRAGSLVAGLATEPGVGPRGQLWFQGSLLKSCSGGTIIL